MNDKKAGWIVTAIIFFSIVSCTKEYYYSSETEIPNGIWASNKAAIFTPTFNDTTKTYNILLSVSNSDDYRNSNIWFFILTKSPDGYQHRDTIEVFLAQEDGKWIGDKEGDNWNTRFYFKKNVRFPKTGEYTFEIIQGMRETELNGINKVGIMVEENKQN